MKSKTSSSNGALFRTNLTRFAPVWALYSAFLLLCFFQMQGKGALDFAVDVSLNLKFVPAVNLVYGLICAQLLFGDLFNTQLCNGVHALPVSRSQLFRVNFLSGLFFSWVPNLIIAVLAMFFMLPWWNMALIWLACACSSFLIFFTLAIFCTVTTGSRLGMALFYGLINAATPLINCLILIIYMPLLPGLEFDFENFGPLCPVYQLSEDIPYMAFIRYEAQTETWSVIVRPELGGYWLSLTVAALVLLWLCRKLYEKRMLETAGDLLSFRILKPLFLAAYTLGLGTCIFVLSQNLLPGNHLFLYVGIAIGFFTGSMLLARSTRVFTKRNLALCAGYLAVMLASVQLTDWDPLGVVQWVPEADELNSATLTFVGQDYRCEDPEMLQSLLDAHESILADPEQPSSGYATRFTYELRSGITTTRFYYVTEGSEAMALLEPFLNSPEFILGEFYTRWADIQIESIQNQYNDETVRLPYFSQEDLDALLAALVADCEAGYLTSPYLHGSETEGSYYLLRIPYILCEDNWVNEQIYIRSVPMDAVHTVAWLEAHGLAG